MKPGGSEYNYEGGELPLFAHAGNWKKYVSRYLAPYIRGDVLEVGSGMGANIPYFMTSQTLSWTALEPDGNLLTVIPDLVEGTPITKKRGFLTTLPDGMLFDTILYIDVLEHIEDDAEELRMAVERLRPEGMVVVLSPAHNYLYSPFDKQVGHFRRYNKKLLLAAVPRHCELIACGYLDSCGFFCSLLNKLVLSQRYPTLEQILFWDRVVVRLSSLGDTLLFNRFGKSIFGIFSKK